jgi:hypothetical protein
MFSRRLEAVANCATTVVSVLLSIVLVKAFLLPPKPASKPGAQDQTQKGKDMRPLLKDVDWSKTGRTVVFALSTQCHFCSASAPFLRKVVQEVGRAQGVKTLAVLPQPVAEAQNYLSSEGVHVDGIVQAEMSSIGVIGTPTWLIVNRDGIVTDAWVGKLDPAGEDQVLRALSDRSSAQKLAGSQFLGVSR